ncbi:SGNH/GDSL hydrolase family protein [Roseivirga sp. E12]|uniref:SGNH/GDSL hydrolase family protein n=1 Tax=Roseivirga sp. E12 TaxID=2819237 RepID=UPI001ABD1A97|nr:SGNH/GDSL hydrolase family protein [Roseivirga sp. E12]MBO3699054.1 SGNH/GDSL hydrolase family protein [Roseivirga sp. E12]
MKKHLFNLMISSVILVALLFGADFLLGALSDQIPEKHTPQRHVFLKEHSPGTSKTYDPPIEFLTVAQTDDRTRKVKFEIDIKGYIKPSNILKDPDVSIAFLGGSTTECSAIDELKRFPYLVGQLFNKDGLKLNTMNAAVSGNNSAHTLNILLNKVLAEQPDIAIMMHNINDLHELLKKRSYWQVNGRPTQIITEKVRLTTALAVKAKSAFPYIGMYFENMVSNIRKEPSRSPKRLSTLTDEDRATILHQFEDNLRLFVSICRIKEISPVLMTQGNRIKYDFLGLDHDLSIIPERFNLSFNEYKKMYFRMNQVIRGVCEEENVLMIDLDKLVLPEHIYDAVHYNDQGSEFVARQITEHLTPLVKKLITNQY